MKRLLSLTLVVLLLPALSACIATTVAGAAVAVVKAPFQLGGAVVDATTTSQSEADRNRGRKERKQEEADSKAAKKAEQERRKAEKAAARDN
jgi:ABC-type Na+ efflux pump permease subunit